jgi:hypothetical protein
MTALNDWSRRQGARRVATSSNEAKNSTSVRLGNCDDAISDAVAHLLRASAAVDRLAWGEATSRSDQAAARLCEAGLAIDRTLGALDEWSKAVRAQSDQSGPSPSMRPDIERVLTQQIQRALRDPEATS